MHAVAPRAADETACCRSIRVEPKRSFGFDAIGHFQPSKQPEDRSANDRFQGTADVARRPPSRDEIVKGVVQRPVTPASKPCRTSAVRGGELVSPTQSESRATRTRPPEDRQIRLMLTVKPGSQVDEPTLRETHWDLGHVSNVTLMRCRAATTAPPVGWLIADRLAYSADLKRTGAPTGHLQVARRSNRLG